MHHAKVLNITALLIQSIVFLFFKLRGNVACPELQIFITFMSLVETLITDAYSYLIFPQTLLFPTSIKYIQNFVLIFLIDIRADK